LATTIVDIYSIIVYFTKNANAMVYYCLIFLLPFHLYFPVNILFTKTKKKISHNLNLGALHDQTFEESPEVSQSLNSNALQDRKIIKYFCSLGISQSYRLACKYLSVGISEPCDLFLDLSLIKFVGKYFQEPTSLSFITQLLSYFPGESCLMNYFFYETISLPNLNFSERFLLYQVNQVRGLRESSTSAEITKHLLDMKTEAKKVISMWKKFWANPMVEFFFQQIC
jgi:hypothetical protein